MRGLAERRAEGPDEVRLRDVGDPGEAADVEGLRVHVVHRVAGAHSRRLDSSTARLMA